MLTEDANLQAQKTIAEPPTKKQKQEEKPFNFQDYVPPLLFDYDYEGNEFQTKTDALLAQERAARMTNEQKWQEQKDRAEDIVRSKEDLPMIPSDPSTYSVNPTMDPNTAASSAVQQFLTRSGVAAGGMMAQKLLSTGGPYGYLGAMAVGTASATLGSLNEYYGQHYSTPYSARRGAKAGDILFENFGSPTLAVEQAINSLESSSMNERSGANIVTAFSKSAKNFQAGRNQIAQENSALQNFFRDSGPFVVPH